MPSNPEKYADIAVALGSESDAEQSVVAVSSLCRDIGIVTQMRELDIPEDAIDDMAEGAMKVTRLLNNNPRELTIDDARQIYREAY